MWLIYVLYLKTNFNCSKDMKKDPKFKIRMIWGGYGYSKVKAIGNFTIR